MDSNIVGYQMHDLKAGPNLMGVAWEGVLAADGKIALSDMMDITQLTSYDETGEIEGDYVQTWDVGSGWGAVYYYVDQPSWNYGAVDYSSTWMDVGFAPCNPTLDAGQAFWLFLKNDINNFSFSGQVAENGAVTTLVAGPNLIANPIPRAVNLADSSVVTVVGATSYDETGEIEGDYVQAWDVGLGWGSVYYYVNQPSWNYGAVDYTDTWMDVGFAPGSAIVPTGSAFWYFAKNADVEITFKSL